MSNYVPQAERKKILFITDDIRSTSGVGTMAREIVLGTSHVFNWVNVGAAIQHPEIGKRIDMSEDTNRHTKLTDANVVVYPANGYGNPEMIRQLLEMEKPDAVMLFTDPRHYMHIFHMEKEIRKKCPIVYYSIWDELPTPLWNYPYYASCDALVGISRQTDNIHKIIMENNINVTFKQVSHGIDQNKFYPVDKSEHEFVSFKNKLFGGKNYEFVVFWNSRNIQRKQPADVIMSFKHFTSGLSDEQASKCVLVMHTQPRDHNGTDLYAVREAICDEKCNVIFSENMLSAQHMNYLYNLADITMLISSAEGWGLSLTESMMAGTMILANATGGMIDQMRFEDENGNWIEYSKEFPSNHTGKYKKCGKWALPVFPASLTLVGSLPTPYIYDSRCNVLDVAKRLREAYDMSSVERQERGLAGSEWVRSNESKMTAENMCLGIIDAVNETLSKYKPVDTFELLQIEDIKPKKIQHQLIY